MVQANPPMPPPPPPPMSGQWGYSYPVVPVAAVHGAAHRLPPRRLMVIAAAALVVIVVVITVVAVAVRPGAGNHCTFACGPPQIGPRLITSSAYHNDKWGYSVDYSTNAFSVTSNDDDSVTLQGQQSLPLVLVQAQSGSDTNAALQNAINALGNEQFSSPNDVGQIPGAEVGEVQGVGEYLTATYQQVGGQQVAIDIVSATQNNVTITVTVVDQPAQNNTVSGISNWDDDFVVSELHWPGAS